MDSKKTSEEKDHQDLKRRSKRTLRLIGCAAILSIVLFGCFQENSSNRIQAVGLGFTIMITSIALGSFIGFLFGLPRFNAENKNKGGSDENLKLNEEEHKKPEREKYSTNSNLEEVSDWLTKIIIGVGLTQLNDLPEKVVALSKKVTENLNISGGTAFIVSFIFFGVIFGFFIGYLVTKLYLEDIFEKRGGRS